MARAKKNHVEEYVLAPKKRWGRRVLWLMVLVGVPALVVGVHARMGTLQEEALTEEMAGLRAMGEPMYACDFSKQKSVPEGENVALLLRGAASAIDEDSHAWRVLDQPETRTPLTQRELRDLERLVELHGPALQMLAEARAKKGVDWSEYYSTPMCDTSVRMDRKQWVLAQLVEAKLLLSHAQGDDREAVQSVADLLMIARAVEELLPGHSHQQGAGISSMMCERIIEISPELQIGQSTGRVSREEILKLVRALADESSLVEGQMRFLRWHRAMHAETVRAVQDERIRPREWRDMPVPLEVMVYAARPGAMADARAILRLSTEVLKAAEMSENWPSFMGMATGPLAEMKAMDSDSGWQRIARPSAPSYQEIMKKHYIALAERRLAATALAMRLYVVEHDGEFPKSLEELTPVYLAQVPADPLARRGNQLRYVADAKRPIVYSVGGNGQDDGGSDKMPPTWSEYCIQYAEDVVAHLKVQERKHIERDEDEKNNLSGGGDGGGAGGYVAGSSAQEGN